MEPVCVTRPDVREAAKAQDAAMQNLGKKLKNRAPAVLTDARASPREYHETDARGAMSDLNLWQAAILDRIQ
jgi:hypothetical protein